MPREAHRRSEGGFDWSLLVVMYLISAFGLFCIAMARYDPAVSANLPLLNKILASRSGQWQAIFLFVSPIIIAVVTAIPTELIRTRTRLAYYGVLLLLLATLAMGVAFSGLRGWLHSDLLDRNIQVSEFAKLSVLLMLARQMSRSETPMSKPKDFFRVLFIAGVPSLAILLQGETGTVIVIVFMFVVMMYFGGVELKIILGIVGVGMIGVGAIVAYGLLDDSPDYRILRLLAFMDPTKYWDTGGYQIIRSQQAIGSGLMTGKGTFLTGSYTTLGYVPEASTDAIFSVVGESFGFVGSVALLAAYLYMVLRMLYLARFTLDKFGRLVIIGVMSMLFFHVFQNVAMSLGLMPITGIPLPFMSYGGSNYISNVAAIALVLNVAKNRSVSSIATMPLPKLNTR